MTKSTSELSLPLNEPEPPAEAPEFEEKQALVRPDLIRKGLGVFAAVGALLFVVLGGYSMFEVSNVGPEKTVRDFYSALAAGDIDGLDLCVDWDRLILQADGLSFGSLSEAQRKQTLERRRATLTKMMKKGGAVYSQVQEIEYRIQKIEQGLDVAEVTVLELSKRTGQESMGRVGLHKSSGRWQIYRLNDL